MDGCADEVVHMKLLSPLAALTRSRNAFPVSVAMPPASPYTQFGGTPQQSYLGYSRAYMGNEIVFSSIEMLATSAGEPHIIGRRFRRNTPTFRAEVRGEEQRLRVRGISRRDIRARMISNGFFEDLPAHPQVRLLSQPNPFLSRGQMWGTVVMDRALAGNAYLFKARTAAGPLSGAVAELWRLRPDRVRVIPDPMKFIAGYEYNTGRDKIIFPAEDIIHFKTRHPLNDYYGMPPLMPISGRLDIDDYMKTFLRDFFEQGGTGPGAVLTMKNKLSPEAKEEIRDRKNQMFGNIHGVAEWLILDNAESTYTPLGLNRGLRDALPRELNAMQEARISMVFGIPGSILGLLIGYESSSYANKRQDWQVFWDLTMTPLLSDLDDVLNLFLTPDFGGIDEVMFDLSDIRALQEDVDAVQERERSNFGTGGSTWGEFREGIGKNPAVGDDEIILIPANMTPIRVGDLAKLSRQAAAPSPPSPPQLPAPVPAPGEPAQPAAIAEVRHVCGRLIARDVQGNPELHCPKCSVQFRPLDKRNGVVA